MRPPTEKHTPTGHIRLVPAWFGLTLRVEIQVRVTYTNPPYFYGKRVEPTYYWRKAKVSDFCNPSFKMTGRPYATSEPR